MVLTLLKRHKAFIFPAILLITLAALTLAKVSGSSVGFFNTFLSNQADDSHLLLNHPQGVRSDEWEVNTPLTIAQAKAGFPRINKDIGNGQDMTAVLDVPYKEWSEIFKPQNWAFFVMPLEYAFAFKWWLLAVLLMLGCYVFCLQLMPKKYLLSSLLAVGLFLSPFVHWWYLTNTLAALAYSFFILTIVIRLFEKSTSKKSAILWSALLSYLLICFGLILYVPFIVPCALVVVAFVLGHLLNIYRKKSSDHKLIVRRLLYCIAAAAVAGLVFVAFLKTRSGPIQAITNTVYPGHRTEASGGFDVKQLLGGPYNSQLQYDAKLTNFPLNQSEASNFILVFLFLIPATIYMLFARKPTGKSKRPAIDWRLVFLLGVLGLLLVRVFVPGSEIIFKLLQLNRVPHNRLLIGFGLLNIVFLIVTLQKIQEAKAKLPAAFVWVSGGLGFLVTLLTGLAIRSAYAGYIQSTAKILLISIVVGAAVTLLLQKRFTIAMGLLVVLSFVSVAKVNPLYRGLSPVINSDLSKSIQAVGDQKGKWVVSEDVIFENVTLANGLSSLSGVYSYPQFNLWDSLKRQPGDQDIYNRYAHAFFSVETVPASLSPNGAYLDPPALDGFRVHADPCSSFLKQAGVHYVLTTLDKSSLACLTQIKEIPYPAHTFRVYEIKQ